MNLNRWAFKAIFHLECEDIRTGRIAPLIE